MWVGAAQAHTPSTKNYAVEIPTWSILRDLQHHMTTSVKCNGLLLPWTTALLIAVEPQPGKYALNSSTLQIYTIHKPAHLTYFVKQADVQGISQTVCSSFALNYVETIHKTCMYPKPDCTTFTFWKKQVDVLSTESNCTHIQKEALLENNQEPSSFRKTRVAAALNET